MTSGRRVWPVRLAAAAETDYENIVPWMAEHFGKVQARAYAQTLSLALEASSAGPVASGAKARGDIAKGVFTLHHWTRCDFGHVKGFPGRRAWLSAVARAAASEQPDSTRCRHAARSGW